MYRVLVLDRGAYRRLDLAMRYDRICFASHVRKLLVLDPGVYDGPDRKEYKMNSWLHQDFPCAELRVLAGVHADAATCLTCLYMNAGLDEDLLEDFDHQGVIPYTHVALRESANRFAGSNGCCSAPGHAAPPCYG